MSCAFRLALHMQFSCILPVLRSADVFFFLLEWADLARLATTCWATLHLYYHGATDVLLYSCGPRLDLSPKACYPPNVCIVKLVLSVAHEADFPTHLEVAAALRKLLYRPGEYPSLCGLFICIHRPVYYYCDFRVFKFSSARFICSSRES